MEGQVEAFPARENVGGSHSPGNLLQSRPDAVRASRWRTKGRLHHHIGSETPGLEAPLGIQFPQTVERSRSQHVDDGSVEKRPFG